jgi:uncharacterized protein YutE (UPF0331/DUF86 family)
VVHREVVAAKVGRARGWLTDCAATFSEPVDAFVGDRVRRDLALFYLFLAIQECIDIAAHWVADQGWGDADEAGSAFDIFADHAVISRQTATALRAAAGLRNRIAHGYAMLEHERIHAEAQAGIPALRTFLVAVASAAGC